MVDEDDPLASRAMERPRNVADVIREAREVKGLSQQALGEQIGTNRYTINRIEGNKQEPTPEQAQRLAEKLDQPEILRLLEQRTEPEDRRAGNHRSRDSWLHALLASPGLDRLVLVLADEIDIVGLLAKHEINLPPRVSIVFPTQERQEQLRGDGGDPTAAWNIQGQINKIFESLTLGGPLRPRQSTTIESDIKLFESNGVRQSFALIGSAEGTHCVTWPTLPDVGRTDDDSVPAAVTNDSAFLQRIEAHISNLLRERAPLTHLKVIVVVEKPGEQPSQTEIHHRFSSFFTLGTDVEEQAAAAVAPEGDFGFAVALVLVHGIVSRTGRTLGRRVLLPWDDKTKTYELYSTHVSDEDLDEERATGRSTQTARGALNALRQRRPDFLIEADAFRRAARRGLKDEFGIDVRAEFLREIPLPPGLWCVPKTGPDGQPRLSVIPRLYELDLTAALNVGGTAGDSLESALLEATTGVAVGRHDFRDKTVQFNDFLASALDDASDWFLTCLDNLQIAWN